jgi:signal transduction histidine kinase
MSTSHDYLAYRIRDGALQDLVAISMLIEAARCALRRGAEPQMVEDLLARAHEAAERDLTELRAVIDALRPAA